ncbi:hypothetical protein MRB53_041502 [Persea americana]|nr:hypothetical protein MRB53_041502 [Persea americana]
MVAAVDMRPDHKHVTRDHGDNLPSIVIVVPDSVNNTLQHVMDPERPKAFVVFHGAQHWILPFEDRCMMATYVGIDEMLRIQAPPSLAFFSAKDLHPVKLLSLEQLYL